MRTGSPSTTGAGGGGLERLFQGEPPPEGLIDFPMTGGQTLFAAGAPAEHLFYLRTGRMVALRPTEGGGSQVLGVIRPGEPIGEMSLIAGTPHSATVVALRDSDVLALPRNAFLEQTRRDPELMAELARLMIRRAREPVHVRAASEPVVFGFVGVSPGLSARDLAGRVAEQVRALGLKPGLFGVEAADHPTAWFSAVEDDPDVVLYAAELEERAWSDMVARQADRLFLIGRGGETPPDHPCAVATDALRSNRLLDLVLIHPAGRTRPHGSSAWQACVPAARIFHVREGSTEDAGRLARIVTGRSVGLVLSGGGARAYAHVGAIRALREAGTPLDFVCGVSMGAVIAACVAIDWGEAEIDDHVRRAFVASSPLADMALPLIAMTQGRIVEQRLLDHFGEIEIADLWRPFFCVSANLTTGRPEIHRQGRLIDCLRASIAIPGVLPPVVKGNEVLVDGAVMRNFPADMMRDWHEGSVIGVDVSHVRDFVADDVARPSSVWRWLRSGDWRKGPPIVSLLMRSATVPTSHDMAMARDAAHLVIAPDLMGVELRDWKAYAPAVEAGYRATQAALSTLTTPVIELRRLRAEAADASTIIAAAPR